MAAKAKLNRGTFTATVDVDIDLDDLADSGWHHEDDCGKGVRAPEWATAALASLHRQAHPSAPSIRLCHEEPCRSLTLNQLDEVTQ